MKVMTYLNATLATYRLVNSESKVYDRNYSHRKFRQYAKFYARVIKLDERKNVDILLLQAEVSGLRAQLRHYQYEKSTAWLNQKEDE